MKSSLKALRVLLLAAIVVLLLFLIMQPIALLEFQPKIGVLFPAGTIGIEERNLLLIIQAIMLVVIIPVYILTFIFSWKYNVYHPEAKYDPDLTDHRLAEYVWWGIPCLIILFISWITVVKTQELDPYKPIESDKKPLTIQAIALQWKWLFLYPEEKIASLNFLQVPTNRPLHFEITADAPMNSLWIPHLGGQIYAMPKMKTELHLIAKDAGDYRGSSANLSGVGFAGMHFITRASSDEDYQKWLESAKESANSLNWEEYTKLAAPSQDNPPGTYQLKDDRLFEQVILKYMKPQEK